MHIFFRQILNSFISSLSQEDSVQKMIEYIVKTPENTEDIIRTLKYPYMSCEVICCDIASITDTLATGAEGKIAEALFDFLTQTITLDPRLSGYFEKVSFFFFKKV
jgi:serine/threonine-protein phosphatase 6 regulatory subunit 3